MDIIIPIAGSRKADDVAETDYIRSLQEIERKTILQYALESLQEIPDSHFVVVVKREDVNTYHIDSIVKLLCPGADIVIAEGETMGAACTCMLAIDHLELDKPLLIMGSDQVLTVSTKAIIEDFQANEYDGGVAIFDDVHPRWSYVKLDENEFVVEAAEKRPISRNAVAGFYYFRKGQDFIDAAQKMVLKNASVNGKFYVCPTYNEMVLQGKTIGTFRVKKDDYYNMNHQGGIDAYESYLRKKAKHENSPIR